MNINEQYTHGKRDSIHRHLLEVTFETLGPNNNDNNNSSCNTNNNNNNKIVIIIVMIIIIIIIILPLRLYQN